MGNQFKDYYRILEVHPEASIEIIEKAKRVLLLRYHPDHNQDKQQWAHEKTKEVLEAYETLSDTQKRITYNRKYERYQQLIAEISYQEKQKRASHDESSRGKSTGEKQSKPQSKMFN